METIGMYFLKMTCWLMAFWLVYHFFLKKDGTYQFNRWFLVSGIISAILMPLYTLRYTVIEEFDVIPPPPPPAPVSEIITENTASFAINWWALVYFIGIVCFIAVTLFRLLKIYQLEKKGVCTTHESTNVIIVNHDLAPFSFFNKIFVSHSLQGNTEIDSVIAHEKVHIEEKHWIDLLLLGFIRVLQWFNPFINLYRKAVIQNHEYLADRGAMQRGVNPFAYKALLANQMLGYQVVGAVSSFGSFNPSKRIEMMNKNKFSRKKQWLGLSILPLIALLLFAFSEPRYEYRTSEDVISSPANSKEVSGIVTNEKGETLPGVAVLVEGTKVGTITDMDGKFAFKDVEADAQLSFLFPGYRKTSMAAKNKMKVSLAADENNGEELILIDDGSAPSPPPPGMKVSGTVTNEDGEPVPGTSIIIKGTNRGTVADMKGKFTLEGLSKNDEIVFSFVGMKTVKLKAKSTLNPVLKASTHVIYVGNNPPPPPPPKAAEKVSQQEMAPPPPPPAPKKGDKIEENKREREVFIIVEDMPKVEGGNEALKKLSADVFGKNFFKEGESIQFSVKANGEISDLSFHFPERNKKPEISDSKVKKFIKGMPKWTPGVQRGKPVTVRMSVLY